RRTDHRDRVGTGRGGIGRELHGVGGRLGAAVGRHLQPPFGTVDEETNTTFALLDGEQHTLPLGAEREQTLETAAPTPTPVPAKRVGVERGAAVAERRQRGGKGAPEHGATLRRPWAPSLTLWKRRRKPGAFGDSPGFAPIQLPLRADSAPAPPTLGSPHERA